MDNSIKIDEYIRNRIRDLRLQNNLSEVKLSTAIGKSKDYLYRMRKDEGCPSFESLVDICNYFEISVSEFFANFPSGAWIKGTSQQVDLVSTILLKTVNVKNVGILTNLFKIATEKEIEDFILFIGKLIHNGELVKE